MNILIRPIPKPTRKALISIASNMLSFAAVVCRSYCILLKFKNLVRLIFKYKVILSIIS